MKRPRTIATFATLVAVVGLVTACSEGSPDSAASSVPAQSSTSSAGGSLPSTKADFASGPAVLVAADYQAPKGKVDSTGAYLPANGKPTLVWVDAIW